MLVSNQPQSSAYSRNNVQNNNVQFKGTIDKSVTNYLKEVRKDIIKTKKNDKLFGLDTIKETKEAISNIMTRLKAFMSQTNEETTLILKKTKTTSKGEGISELRFKDNNTSAEISACTIIQPKMGKIPPKIIDVFFPPLEITTKPASDSIVGELFGLRGRHTHTRELQQMDTWSKNLTDKVHPTIVDIALHKKFIAEQEMKSLAYIEKIKKMSDAEKTKFEMKQAIKELKDINIEG